VVIDDGRLLGWLGRTGQPLITFLREDEDAESPAASRLAEALAALVDGERRRALIVSTIDGVAGRHSPLAPAFRAAGFVATLHGLMTRGARAPDDDGGRAPTDDELPEAWPDA
jgi:hypothetical protein